jgi:exodeoxyribonuclease VII large subunit
MSLFAETPQETDSSNDRVESVSAFTRRLKTVLERQIRPCWIRGEVSNLRAQASGHLYFCLKDAGAALNSVLFRGDAARQSVKLRDGQQVVVYGEVSVYEARGQYQLIVRAVIEDGEGRLRREFEALKQRLADEGLFAAERKRPIPTMPLTIGFITSPTGAAVQDFLRILKRRSWRGRVVVLPAKVQGEGAAAEIVAMLELAQALKTFDLLVIGRGGGSLEDLWAFNEEPLVRAVASCETPIISAVGHEIDFTLCDFAADARAETPSAAAELISSHFVAHTERTVTAAETIVGAVEHALARADERLDHARSRLRLLSPAMRIEQNYLKLDDLANRLPSALQGAVHRQRHRLSEVRSLLIQHSPEKRVQFESHRLLALWKRLQAVSPKSVLNRGFVILRDEAGQPVPKRKMVKGGQRLTAEFGDGTAEVRAE